MKKIRFYFIGFLVTSLLLVKGQTINVDILKNELAAAKDDSVKVNLAQKISNAYSNKNIDSMIYYSKLAINLLKHALQQEKEVNNKLSFLWTISSLYQYVNNDSMLFYAQQGYLFSKKNKKELSADGEAMALSILARALWWGGNYPDAKETYFKALKLAEPLGDTSLTAGIYIGIALINRLVGNFRTAIIYYSVAEKMTRNIPDTVGLFNVLGDKGKSYEQLGILDSAFTCIQECLAILFRKYKKKNVGGPIYAEMGIIYSKMGKEDLASEFFRQSLYLCSEAGTLRLLARSYCEFAEHFERYNKPDSAIFYATKGFLIDKQFNLLIQQVDASSLLTRLYKRQNNIDSAFKYQQLMINTRDSILNLEKIIRLQTLEFNEQLRQQDVAAAKIAASVERKRNIQYSLIAIGIVIFIILFFFLSRSFITNTKLIEILGIIALLLVFEFLGLLIHPVLGNLTHHLPGIMLLFLVCIAGILVPLHNRLEKWIIAKLIEKNKEIRLARARRTIKELEVNNEDSGN